MRDDQNINYVVDEGGYCWLVDEDGSYVYSNGQRVPGPARRIQDPSGLHTYDTAQGHCEMCGHLACRGGCFK